MARIPHPLPCQIAALLRGTVVQRQIAATVARIAPNDGAASSHQRRLRRTIQDCRLTWEAVFAARGRVGLRHLTGTVTGIRDERGHTAVVRGRPATVWAHRRAIALAGGGGKGQTPHDTSDWPDCHVLLDRVASGLPAGCRPSAPAASRPTMRLAVPLLAPMWERSQVGGGAHQERLIVLPLATVVPRLGGVDAAQTIGAHAAQPGTRRPWDAQDSLFQVGRGRGRPPLWTRSEVALPDRFPPPGTRPWGQVCWAHAAPEAKQPSVEHGRVRQQRYHQHQPIRCRFLSTPKRMGEGVGG